MGKMRILYRLVVLVAFWAGSLQVTANAAGQLATIRGQIYISPSGDLDSPWVVFGKDVEVILLRDDGTFDQKLKELRGGWMVKIKAQEKVAQQANDRFVRSKTSKEKAERQSILKDERLKLERLAADYRKEVDALIKKYRAASTKADGEGKFAFEDLTGGRYLLHASFEVLRTDQWYYWLVPVDLQEGAPAEVHLKKDNSVALYYSG